ncbi:hypothetical protein [Streptomyces sp. CB01881]|uniref:hypothetical protein n=1 Tax=Streptomyces sp. CB01881 TaxID=2078691 RepID=UPI000CDBE8FB|nr:hypothetical protein [Streptomyces sp. CB01881]AUY51429.1 hypothetical protein C2142_23665 [Streptomyces sp. CB01881]TYC74821.1 hypothetical protein EH183_23650 [Streptomyces sp. CB01881]
MNLDFSAEPLFSWYVVLLAISGIAMVVLGAINIGGGLSGGWRAVNVLAGMAFAGYAYYLAFVFEGGEYRMFFQAFVLPLLLIANAVKSLLARGNTPVPQPAPGAAPYDPNAQFGPGAQYNPYAQSAPVPPQGAPAAPAPAAPPVQPQAPQPPAV